MAHTGQIKARYRVRPVPIEQNSAGDGKTKVKAIFSNDKSKKGLTGLYELVPNPSDGQHYDVDLPNERGTVRLHESELAKYDIRLGETHLYDTETGEDVNLGGF